MTTQRDHFRSILLVAIALALGPVAPGCGTSATSTAPATSATPDVRSQPLPSAKPATPPKPGTREYKKQLEELTDIRPGSLDVRTDCRSKSGKSDSDCRDCAREIRKLRPRTNPAMKPAPAPAPPRPQGSKSGPM